MKWDEFVKHRLPTRKHERFKYTDFSFLAKQSFVQAKRIDPNRYQEKIREYRARFSDHFFLVLVNGFFMPALSDVAKLPERVIACSLSDAMKNYPELIKKSVLNIDANKYPFASLNEANEMDGLFLYVPSQCTLQTPIHLLSVVFDQDQLIAHPKHCILLDDESRATLIEEHVSSHSQTYLMNFLTSMYIGKNATLDYYKLQQEGECAVHIAHTFIRQMQASEVNGMYFSSGSAFARDDVIVKLEEPGAICRTNGFYYLRHANQYIDHHIEINHIAERSQSEMFYKGILAKKSRAVFNGRLHVIKLAQKTVAYQANHNLLLANDAEVYSKPELEIYADDVKCKHGATTGQLDPAALFYLRSRGISHDESVALLLQGFAEEFMQRVQVPSIKLHMQEMVQPC